MSDLTRVAFGWVAYILAIAILGIWLVEVARADPVWAVNTPTAKVVWDTPTDGPTGAYYQIERNDGTQFARPWALSTDLTLPDRTATTPISVRVRTCVDAFTCGAWSPPSDLMLGVPLGWQPDTNGDQVIDGGDFPLWNRAFREGWTWPQ